MRRRQLEQEAALGGPGPWDGHWTLWVVHPGARTAADRTALRGAAGRARLAEVRDGLWTRPANLGPAVVAEDDQELLRRSADRWLARPEHEPAEQAARLFPVLDLERAGRRLEQRLDDVRADLAGPDLDDAALALAFVVGSAVLRHLRRDPLLPDELVQPTVGGAPVAGRLRAAYPAYEADFGRAVAAWWDRGPAARDSRA